MNALKIVFLRHAAKNKNGELTKKGKEEALRYFSDIYKKSLPTKGIEIYSSSVKRAISTAEILCKISPVPVLKQGIIKALKEDPFSDEDIMKLGLGNGKWLEKNKPSPLLPPSTTISNRVEKIIQNFIDDTFSNKSQNQVRVIFCVSHAPTIMLFAKKIFIGEIMELKGRSLLSKMGGFTQPLQGLEINIKKNNKKLKADYSFNNIHKKVTLDL